MKPNGSLLYSPPESFTAVDVTAVADEVACVPALDINVDAVPREREEAVCRTAGARCTGLALNDKPRSCGVDVDAVAPVDWWNPDALVFAKSAAGRAGTGHEEARMSVVKSAFFHRGGKFNCLLTRQIESFAVIAGPIPLGQRYAKVTRVEDSTRKQSSANSLYGTWYRHYYDRQIPTRESWI